jgi:hypothetical protein
VGRVPRASYGAIGHRRKNSAWSDGAEFGLTLGFWLDGKRQHSHIPTPTGHRRVFPCRIAAPAIDNCTKVRIHVSFRSYILNFGYYREGKRVAEEEEDAPHDVKKVRLDGDEDVLMGSETELPTNKRMPYSIGSRR